jgi:hypothetical protein
MRVTIHKKDVNSNDTRMDDVEAEEGSLDWLFKMKDCPKED